MKQLLNEVIETYREHEALHFEETRLSEMSDSLQKWYYNLDFGNKEDVQKFLLLGDVYNFTDHMYYKLLKLKYEIL